MHYTFLLAAILTALAAALATGQVLAHARFPIPDATRRIGCVDGLRGYLALLVMMHHFDLWTNKTVFGQPWGASSSMLLRHFGAGGVLLFFMTTGLVFYPRIERGLRAIDWRSTYISRAFRILPLQLVMVAVAAAISLAISLTSMPPMPLGSVGANAKSLLSWITSYHEAPLFGYEEAGSINAYVLWSLWYEWLFYLLLLPLLAWLYDLVGARLPPLAIPIGAVLFGIVVGPFARFSIATVIVFLPLFAFGMIAFVLRRYPRVRGPLSSRVAAVVAAAALAVVMATRGNPHALPNILGYALFFTCVAAGNSFFGLFALRGSVVLGEISFGLYLIHGTVLYLLFTFLVRFDTPLPVLYALLPLAAIVAVLVAAAAHLAIERPGIALGRRLAGRPARRYASPVEREIANVAP